MFESLQFLNVDRRVRQTAIGHADRRRRRHAFPAAIRIEPLDRRVLLSAGNPDLSFAGAGWRAFDFGAGDDFGYAVAVQSDGRIVVAGTVRAANGTTDFGLVRFLPDGSLDMTFGSGGVVTTDFGSSSASADEARGLVIDASGRIYVAGWTNRSTTGNDFALARYNPDGSLDSSFGTGGKVVNHFSGHDQAMAIALQPDGKVVLAGLIGNDFGLARYNGDGTFDTSFGTGGFVRTAVATALDMATSLAIGADGKIYAGGYVQFTTTNVDFATAVYNPNGTPDTSFNGTGRATLSLSGTVDQATSIALLGDGRFVLAGRSGGNVLLVRYNPDGSRDRTFTSTGLATIDLGGSADTANAMILMSDGSMLLAGAAGDSSAGRDFAVFKVTPTGTLDGDFGTGGIVRSDFFGNADEAFAMTVGGDGKLVVVGRTDGFAGSLGYSDFAVARYRITSNAAPQASISGPSTVAEGSSVLLDASGSFDSDGTIVSYEWDFDYDGSSFNASATGLVAEFSAASIDGPATRVVALRVTDDGGESHVTTHAIQITNVPPTASLSGPTSAQTGAALSFTVHFHDPGSADTHRVRFDFGDGTVVEVDAFGGAATVSHTYAASGSFTVSALVIDDDGGSGAASMSLNVTDPPPPPPPPPPRPEVYEFVPDPLDPGKMMLIVHGTEQDDKVRFQVAAGGGVDLRFNGEKLGVFQVTSRIVAYGNAGNDELVADEFLDLPVQFYGGAGNDVLRGGSRGDTLDGGDGHDKIWARAGDDLLLGGPGDDTLFGDAGDDTLVGGSGRNSFRDSQGNNVFFDGGEEDEESDELLVQSGPGKSKTK